MCALKSYSEAGDEPSANAVARISGELANLDAVLAVGSVLEFTLVYDNELCLKFFCDGIRQISASIVSEVVLSSLEAEMRGVLATGEPFAPKGFAHLLSMDVEGMRRQFSPVIMAVGSRSPFHGLILFLQDVSDYVEIDQRKTNILGDVSHELKSPISGLQLVVTILQEERVGALNDRQKSLLSTAIEEVERMTHTVKSLLDLAWLESLRGSQERRLVSIPEILNYAVKEVYLYAERSNIHLKSENHSELTLCLAVGFERLICALVNLLTNAIKHSPEGGEVVLAVIDQGEHILFSVIDAGDGISPEHQDRIFDRFYKAPGNTKVGSGLGLAIAREIVEDHQGTISIESKPGRTCFEVKLPKS